MATPKVVDLSRYQDGADLAAMQKGGVIAVILKCTEGTTIADSCFAGFRSAAQAIGLPYASYHFLRPGSIEAQMEFYMATLNPRRGERVVIDYEDDALELGELHQAVETLRSFDHDLQITIYSGHLIKDQLGQDCDPDLSDTALWVAQYTSASSPSWPKGTWPIWSLWQYTDNASVPGYSGPVDGDRFNGSDAQCVKWFGPADEPAPAPAPPEAVVEITTTGKVKVIVNGAPVS